MGILDPKPVSTTAADGIIRDKINDTASAARGAFNTATSTEVSTAGKAARNALDGLFAPKHEVYVAAPTGNVATDGQNIRDALALSTVANPRHIILARGTYKIDSELRFPNAPGTKMSGQGRFQTTIERTTTGGPIIAVRDDLLHSLVFEGFGVKFSVKDPGAGSNGFLYHVPLGTSGGIFHHTYRDIYLGNVYSGFKLADNDGQQTVWNALWEDIHFGEVQYGLWTFRPAVAIGIPALTLRNIGSYSTPTHTDPRAFDFLACEVNMNGIDLESWSDTAIYADGGGFVNVTNLHIESHKFKKAFSALFFCANGPMTINGFSIHGSTTASNTDAVQILTGQGNGRYTLAAGHIDVTTTAGTAYIKEVLYSGDASITGTVQNVTSTTGINLPGVGSRAADTLALTTGAGLLPDGRRGLLGKAIVMTGDTAALPTATAALRGEIRLVRGNGSTTADTLHMCMISATGTYAWKQIAAG